MTYSNATAWFVACDLLGRWVAAGVPDPSQDVDDIYDAWTTYRERVFAFMAERPCRAHLDEAEGTFVENLADEGPIAAHAAAWELDVLRWPAFTRPWIRNLVIDLKDGDLYPISDWDDQSRPLVDRLSRPWQGGLRHGELPHVRRHATHESTPPIRFDGTYFDDMGFLSYLKVVSGVLLNETLEEFDIPATSAFPVTAVDEAEQVNRAVAAAAQELEGPSGLIVYPELAVPEEAVSKLAQAVKVNGRNTVIVAGSRHVGTSPGTRANLASLITPSGDVIHFRKRTRLWDRSHHEGIDECHDPLQVLVTGEARIAVLICKDFMSPDLVEPLTRCGVNLAIVPSMTQETDLHDVSARQLARGSHGISVVVNGPRHWGLDDDDPPTMLIGRPERSPARTVQVARGHAPVAALRCDLLAGSFDEYPGHPD